MLGWGLWQTSSNDSGGGRSGNSRTGAHGGGRGWPDDDDYNNRDFRGLEIAARAFARSDIQAPQISRMNSNMIKGIVNCFLPREDNWNFDTLLLRARNFSFVFYALLLRHGMLFRAYGCKEDKAGDIL